MKRILNKLLRNERGQALIIVLILLGLGGLLIAPLLGHMGTGLKAGLVFEKKIDELYAADAGVEDAFAKIITGAAGLPGEENPTVTYSIANVNDKSVEVTMERLSGTTEVTYKIISVATSDNGSSTTIESIAVMSGGFAYLLDNAITSPGDVTLQPGVEVYGDVQYNGDLDNKGDIYGDEITDEVIWPTAEYLSGFYWDYVDDLTPVPDGYTIDISSGTEEDPYLIGPLCAEGDLTITGSGVARLDGTIYVGMPYSKTGNFNIMPSCILLLNDQAIYAEGEINFQPNCATSGSGCIIAVGDVNYQPDIMGNDYVLLMSIEGTVRLKPGGSFYGSIAGNAEVELLPGTTLNYVTPSGDLPFPGGSGGGGGSGSGFQIPSWKVGTSPGG